MRFVTGLHLQNETLEHVGISCAMLNDVLSGCWPVTGWLNMMTLQVSYV